MPDTPARQTTRSHCIHLPASRDCVFPLFEPLGEKLWAADWEPELIAPISGQAQVGTTFLTRHLDEPEKIWTIIVYEREQTHITYLNVLPQMYTNRIDVRCEPEDAEATAVWVTYTLTALSSRGNHYIDVFTQERYYQSYIASWEAAIRDYLLHQERIPHAREHK